MIGLTLVSALSFSSTLIVHAAPSAATASQAQSLRNMGKAGTLPSGCAPQTPVTGNTTTGNGLGNTGFYTYDSRTLDDRLTLLVNVGNGNLVLDASDLHIRGTGIDLTIQRFFNSFSSSLGSVGKGWVLGTGSDVKLVINSGSATFDAPSGYVATFSQNGSGAYEDAPGLNATLLHVSGNNTYTLTFHRTGECLVFNSAGQLTTDSDRNGNQLCFYYDGSGRLTSITDTQGRVTTFTYSTVFPTTRIVTITDPAGRTVQYTYSLGTCTLCGPVELTSVTDLNGKTTTYTYEHSTGKLIGIADPNGNLTSIAYNTSNKVASITDPLGNTTSYSYPLRGTQCPSGTSATVVTDARSNATTYCYDPSTLLVKAVFDALGHMRQTSYTSNYDVAMLTDPLSQTTQFTWSTDGYNNLQSVADATGAKTTFDYNTGSGNPYLPDDSHDAQSNQLAYSYDAAGNLTQTQQPDTGVTVKRTYNANGTVATETDGDGNVTSFSYDGEGNLALVTPPSGSGLGTTQLSYDGLSRVTQVIDGKNQKTQFTYDNDDRITQITYNDNSTVSYTYDANGNTLTVKDPTGTTTFVYDKDNRDTSKTFPDTTALTYAYDGVGNLTSQDDVNGNGTTSYAYDAVNDLSAMTLPNNQQVKFTYDNDARRTQTAYPNGALTVNITYDHAGRETGITASTPNGTLENLSYCYSDTNPCSTTAPSTNLRYYVTDNQGKTYTHYMYDPLNRLTDAKMTSTNGGGLVSEYSYTYDASGNRTKQVATTSGTTTTTYSYNPGNILASSSVNGGQATTYSFDGDGNLTGSSAGLSLSYNTLNQTTSITAPSSTTTSFSYAGADQTERVGESTSSGSLKYTTGLLGVSHQIGTGSDPTRYFERDNRGNLVAEESSSDSFSYYLFDATGSVVGITDASGNLLGTYSYDPYGDVTSTPNQLGNPYQFASGYYDASTGYLKFGERYDDPTQGRWTQQDPVGGSLGNPSSVCRYLYAQDNPVNLTDPSGKCSVAAAIFLTIGVAATSIALVVGIESLLPAAGFAAFFGAAVGSPGLISSLLGYVAAGGGLLACLFGF